MPRQRLTSSRIARWQNGIRLVGLNVPAPVVELVRDGGMAGLDPELAQLLPKRMDFNNAKHRARFDKTMAELAAMGVRHMGVGGGPDDQSSAGAGAGVGAGAGAGAGVGAGTVAQSTMQSTMQRYYECEVLWDEYV